MTSYVLPESCTSSKKQTLTTTITETVYVTITQYFPSVLSTTSTDSEDNSVCEAPTLESKNILHATISEATITATVYPIPVSEYTTFVTSFLTKVITLTLIDAPVSSYLENEPISQSITPVTYRSTEASQILITQPSPSASTTSSTPVSSTNLSTHITLPTPSTSAKIAPTTSAIPTTLSAVPSRAYGSSGWNSTIPTSTMAQGTGILIVSGALIPKPSFLSQPAYEPISKRQVGAMVTATINDQVVSWLNVWKGSPLSSPAQSLTSVVESTKTITTPSSVPTKCGELGEFTMDFDDLPRFSPADNNTAPFPPIFNPYYHLFFSDGWAYGPPPTEPYPPISNPHIGIYVPSAGEDNHGSPYAGLLAGGQFGAGPRSSINTFWFDAYSTYFGCDNGSTNNSCAVTVSAVRYSTVTRTEEDAGTRTFTLPPCPGYENCALSPLDFGDSFSGISGLQFSAFVGDKPVIWFIDNIKMNWYNNSCTAGLERLRSR
ncbi:hypothetical protein GX48_07815 [Paracoccidioides brasiliensis]|nr:hypothetical protein GX48_07815 [Paracoccidioides brasiliensis]